MKVQPLNKTLIRLSLISQLHQARSHGMSWPDHIDADTWCFTPELVSLYGTGTWHTLGEQARKRLSFFEAVNFFSLNVHNEKFLISEVSRRLYRGADPALDEYLLHFIAEEVQHMQLFGGFCERYLGQVYGNRALAMNNTEGRHEDLLLFARIHLFEEVVDEYNQIMARDERLNPIVREINLIHHRDESRHLAFGRSFLVEQLTRGSEQIDAKALGQLRSQLQCFRELVWSQFYNPEVYTNAGLPSPLKLRQQGVAALPCRERRKQIEQRRFDLLRKLQLLEADT